MNRSLKNEIHSRPVRKPHFLGAYSRPLLCLAMALAMVLPGRAVRAAQAKELNAQLLANAGKVIEVLSGKGYKNVGILKFRVKKGAEPLSDNVGALNSMLADQLEVAMILKDPPTDDKQIGIIHHASATAAKISGASHLTPEGRKTFFTSEYPLAWGDTKVVPDVMITGVVIVTPDLKEMSIGLLMFDKNGSELQKVVPQFTARVDASTLSELGESFAMRSAFESGKIETVNTETIEKAEKEAVETAAKVKAKEASFPLSDSAAAISLEIQYDGKPIKVETKNGKAFVAEPNEGQKVALIIKRVKSDGKRYGVVLKVNGENTLQKEKSRDLDCRKWVVDPDRKQLVVEGFQIDTTTREKFNVLSVADSKKTEVNYGDDTGLISMTVFAELKGEVPAAPLGDEDAADLVAVNRGAFPKDSLAVNNLSILKARFADITRGLVAAGAVEASATKVVTFKANPTPIESTIIRYYNRQAGFPADLPAAP